MALRRSSSSISHSKENPSNTNALKTSTKKIVRLQSAPPLSLQQYARTHFTNPSAPKWQPSGSYHPPPFHEYMPPEVRETPQIRDRREQPQVKPWNYSYRRKNSIISYTLKDYKDPAPKPKPKGPEWRPPSKYEDKRPTSLSPARRSVSFNSMDRRGQTGTPPPVWRPPGKTEYKPMPYFDAPNLRWSIQDLKKSVNNFQTISSHRPTSASVTKVDD